MKNRKIRGSEFETFRGCSLLLDVPGRSIRGENGLEYLHCDLGDDAVALFRALAGAARRLAGELAQFGACLVPPEAYHLTVMDGINDANVDQLAQPARGEAEAWLAGLPDSAFGPPPAWFPPPVVSLPERWALQFRFKRLAIGSRSADLVAQVEPTDDSAESMALIGAVRSELERPMVERGKTPNSAAWAPHCTLAYFPSAEAAEAALPRLEAWNNIAAELTAGKEFRSTSISLYSFVDMTRFLRHRLPAMVLHRSTIESAIERRSGYIGENGDQKVCLTVLLSKEHERVATVAFQELAPNGKRNHMITCGFGAAVFDGRAEQLRHRHAAGTECYACLRGTLELEVEGSVFALGPGDTAIVRPGAAHNIKSGGAFLARVITLNCGGAADRFPAEGEPSGGCTPEHARIVRAADLRSGGGLRDLSLGDAGEIRTVDHRGASEGPYARAAGTEFWWVIDGSMSLEVNGETLRLAEGDLAIVNPGAIREVKQDTPFLARVLSFGGSGAEDVRPADFSRFDSAARNHSGFWKRSIPEVNAGLEEMRAAQRRSRTGVTLVAMPLPANVLKRVAEARRILDGMLPPQVKVKWRENADALHVTVWGVVKPADWAEGRWPLPAEMADGIRHMLAGNLPIRLRMQGLGILGSGSVCMRIACSRELDRIRDGIERLPLVSGRGRGENFVYVALGRVEPGIGEADRQALGRCMQAMEQFRFGDVTVTQLQLVHYRREFLDDVADRVTL